MFPSKYAVETKEEMIIRHRAEGRSEQEIAFFQAENQKEYESILNDPNTPEKVISMIVDGITLTHLKILAILHPNINIRSIKYIIEKADKKGNQKDLIKAYLNSSKLDLSSWYDMRKYYNVAGKLFFFGQLAAPIITGKEKESNTKVNSFSLAGSAGFDYIFSKHVTVEFSYRMIDYTHTTLKPESGEKTTMNSFNVAGVANTNTQYTSLLGASPTNILTPFSFGFKFIF